MRLHSRGLFLGEKTDLSDTIKFLLGHLGRINFSLYDLVTAFLRLLLLLNISGNLFGLFFNRSDVKPHHRRHFKIEKD